MDLGEKTDEQIAVWIANHENRGATATPLYGALVEEWVRRAQQSTGLKSETTLAALRQAAIEQRCTTYGDLAAASDLPWTQAHRLFGGPKGHLAQILALCHARGLPLLTALCVNKQDVVSGDLSGDALSGFATGARRLGYVVTDEQAFHREQRDTSWAWGKGQSVMAPLQA